MMLRSLVDEVVRRRLWPIPLAALLIAIAAPLLFMKSAPTNAPTAAPAPATPKALPKKAGNLLEPSDRALVSTKPSKRKAQDPFAPPAQAASPSKASGTASAPGGGSGTARGAQSVPVVIKNSDGTTSTATIAPSTSKSTKTTKTPRTTTKSTTPKPRTPTVTVPKTSSSSAATTSKVTYVDVRFGEVMGTMTRYRVPRMQAFRADGKVAAMFVKYSPVRNAAVFAVAPSTQVSGVKCREVKGICRYVDIPSGLHARLKLVGDDGETVSRRLDVVRIRHLPKVAGSKASALTTTLPAARCLLKRLLALPASAPSITADSCD